MKTLFQKITRQFRRYSNLSKKVNDTLPFKKQLPITVFSLVLSLLILSMPFLLVVNLASIIHLRWLWSILFVILITLFPWIFQYTYYSILKEKYEEIKHFNIKFLFIFESIMISAMLFLLSLMIILLI